MLQIILMKVPYLNDFATECTFFLNNNYDFKYFINKKIFFYCCFSSLKWKEQTHWLNTKQKQKCFLNLVESGFTPEKSVTKNNWRHTHSLYKFSEFTFKSTLQIFFFFLLLSTSWLNYSRVWVSHFSGGSEWVFDVNAFEFQFRLKIFCASNWLNEWTKKWMNEWQMCWLVDSWFIIVEFLVI